MEVWEEKAMWTWLSKNLHLRNALKSYERQPMNLRVGLTVNHECIFQSKKYLLIHNPTTTTMYFRI